jgi:hypothetical protein
VREPAASCDLRRSFSDATSVGGCGAASRLGRKASFVSDVAQQFLQSEANRLAVITSAAENARMLYALHKVSWLIKAQS